MIPPGANAAFVWRMEDVLAVSERPYGPDPPRDRHGRAAQAVAGRHAPARAAGAGAGRAPRLRVRAPGNRQRVPVLRAARGAALGHGDRPPHERGLGPPDSGTGRRALPRGRADHFGLRQPEHAHPGGAVRGVRARGGAAAGGHAGDPSHPQARQWAQHRGDRAERAQPPVPRPPRAGRRDPGCRSRRLARPAQRGRQTGRLALHDGGCAHPAQAPLPISSRGTEHYR